MATRDLKSWIVDRDLLSQENIFLPFEYGFPNANRFLGKYGKDGLF